MGSVPKHFNDVCKEKYVPLGFKRVGKVSYARNRGDHIQSFTLTCAANIREYSVQFGIIPLCSSTPVYLDGGIHTLNSLIVEMYKRYWGWTFAERTDEDIKKCINEISHNMDLYMIPFFERCVDCRSSLEETIKLERAVNNARLEWLILSGRPTYSDSLEEQMFEKHIFYSPRRYYMALKSDNWDYMRKYYNVWIDNHKKLLADQSDPNVITKQTEEVIKRVSDKLALHMEQLKHLDEGDFAYFVRMRESNEKQLREYLLEKYPELEI